MRSRVCLVTGAAGGIGKETARTLAKMGATVLLVSRDRARGEQAAWEIAADSGNAEVVALHADLSAQEQVCKLAEEVKQRCPKLHVLVNNAGCARWQRGTTVDGIERTFATNHLAAFLLTNLLLDLLKASAPARIINVSSMGHRRGHVAFDDLQGESRYSGRRAYRQSKLANVLFTYELARRLAGTTVTANCLHPGVVATGLARSALGRLMKLAAPFMLTPAEGARTSVYLASSPDVEGVTGKYFIACRAVNSSRESYDEATARRLWEVSARLTGLENTWPAR